MFEIVKLLVCVLIFKSARGQFGIFGNRQQAFLPSYQSNFNPQNIYQQQSQNYFGWPQNQNLFGQFSNQQLNMQSNDHYHHNHHDHEHYQPTTTTKKPRRKGSKIPPAQSTATQPPPIITTTERPTTAAQLISNDGRISQRKCFEYSNVIKRKVQVASLSNNPTIGNVNVVKCSASTSLIVGGQTTKPGEFPHMAAIGWHDFDGNIEFKCGGSLISERFVLTAAHCEKADRTEPKLVRLGEQNLKIHDIGLPEEDYNIAQFISHELYDKDSMHNDIALIRLNRDVKFSNFIRPACLQQVEVANNVKAVACGWGYTEAFGSTSDELLKAELDIIENVVCKTMLNDSVNYDIDHTQICAGILQGGKDTCSGDSGGPLQMVTATNQCIFHVIGVTSYGTPYCGVKNSPGIYTKVSAYLDWIENKVWP